MAKAKWAAFPYDNKAFDYAGDTLLKSWAKLHAGDQEPYPDAARVTRLLKSNSKLGKAAAEDTAAKLQDAWRAYHRGDFQQAAEIGDSLGALGAVVSCKATGIHTVYLVKSEAEKLRRFEQVAARAAEAANVLPDEANCHYFHAFALGRFSQMISIAKALSQGFAGKVRASLDKTLKLAPKHAEAHLALALYHAEIVGKVGGMLATLTYGAKASTAEEHIKTATRLTPDAPIVYVEQANALLLLYGDKRSDEAATAFDQAAKIKPHDAMQALDAAHAKDQLS
jgi:tetratricopeptide (TPR) repeat protein